MTSKELVARTLLRMAIDQVDELSIAISQRSPQRPSHEASHPISHFSLLFTHSSLSTSHSSLLFTHS
jgi:hypothetical protein